MEVRGLSLVCNYVALTKSNSSRVEYRPLEGFVLAVSPFNFTAIGGNLPGSQYHQYYSFTSLSFVLPTTALSTCPRRQRRRMEALSCSDVFKLHNTSNSH